MKNGHIQGDMIGKYSVHGFYGIAHPTPCWGFSCWHVWVLYDKAWWISWRPLVGSITPQGQQRWIETLVRTAYKKQQPGWVTNPQPNKILKYCWFFVCFVGDSFSKILAVPYFMAWVLLEKNLLGIDPWLLSEVSDWCFWRRLLSWWMVSWKLRDQKFVGGRLHVGNFLDWLRRLTFFEMPAFHLKWN